LAAVPMEEVKPKLIQILQAAGDRVKVAGDILDFADFFLPDDQLPYDQQAVEKCLRKPGAAELLQKCRDRLAAAEPFDPPTLEKLIHDFVAAEGIKIGDIVLALRVAITGKSIGMGLFDALAILGREHSLARIDRALRSPLPLGED
jgi:glutamyl-tRNA synthetase